MRAVAEKRGSEKATEESCEKTGEHDKDQSTVVGDGEEEQDRK